MSLAQDESLSRDVLSRFESVANSSSIISEASIIDLPDAAGFLWIAKKKKLWYNVHQKAF